MRTKDDIRRFINEERAKLKKEWVKENSWQVQEKLVALPEFRKAKSVCCYCALPGEVETDLVIEMCWTDGKRMCVPAFRREMNQYGLAELRRDSKMVERHFGVSEPENLEWIDAESVKFFVVPGLAFDSFGGRVGHGGGYYDRILQGVAKEVFKAGLAFDFQIFERIPVSAGDVGMDVVITEKWVFRSAGSAI